MPSRLYKHPRLFKTFLNVYPPYWGTGIRVTALAADFSRMDVRMDISMTLSMDISMDISMDTSMDISMGISMDMYMAVCMDMSMDKTYP